MAKVDIKDLVYYYPELSHPALNNINLSIESGEFVVLIGPSGSGKSTLLRAIAGLIPGFYRGKMDGEIYIGGEEIGKLSRRELASKVGLLFQEPESQIVKTKVENEIAFGMENIGVDFKVMQRRVAEISEALSLIPHLNQNVNELSGGSKQKLALASILAIQPDILLLDEPISQLDPIAAKDLLNVIRHLNEDLGITIILIEHRLENFIGWANRVVAFDGGYVLYDGSPEKYCKWAQNNNYSIIPDLPRLFAEANFLNIPLNVKEARKIISNLGLKSKAELTGKTKIISSKEPFIDLQNISFKYTADSLGISEVNLTLYKDEFAAVIGHNGAGKTTLIKTITGILKPDRGKLIRASDKLVGYVPQNPDDFLYLPTVEEEIKSNLADKNELEGYLDLFALTEYRHSSPRDLSFGEKQRVVLATVLGTKPEILCLDEPTRGLDYKLKKQLGELLNEINNQGTSIILVSNDMEFIAEYSKTIILMFKGKVIDYGTKYDILSDSNFYAPQVNRLFKDIDKKILTFQEATHLLGSHDLIKDEFLIGEGYNGIK
ncbi:MAG TPA: ATP-binding cassette domain-containing protein [Syntrophomonadaceae bacterium]|nr:ATP-binding cassette domain-containing protein [Syntrophomonadaceae bacterium]